jgi:YD repeat-containing protein
MSNNNNIEPIFEYDANGNMIHAKHSDGYETWRKYDANNKLIHYKDSNGIEEWYDSDGNLIDKPTEKKDNATMNEYYIKIHATSIASIDKALGDQVGKNGLGGYYVLTENSHSCAICHTDSHLYVERNEANDLAEYLLNKDKGYLEPRTGDKFYTENDD